MCEKKLGIVLEGGGARGAYQAGAVTAFLSCGYKFDGVTGTSIGALNGVMLAQNRFDESYLLWQNMEFSVVFDVENKYATNVAIGKYDKDTIKYFFGKIRESISNKGVDTTRIKRLLDSYIDEDRLRNSKIDFGIMTVSLTEFKPYPLFIEDIPKGMVSDYVMASATFPGFRSTYINNQRFVDGGVYDNMPVNMLIDKGYNDIIAIETKSVIPKRKCKDVKAQIEYIRPSEKPGRVLDFTPESVSRAMRIGHFDVMRFLYGLKGEYYYIDLSNVTPFGYGFLDMKKKVYTELAKIYGLDTHSKDKNAIMSALLQHINSVNKKNYGNFADAILYIFEKVAMRVKLERLRQYDMRSFPAVVLEKIREVEAENNYKRKAMDIKAIDTICKYYYED